MVVELTRRGGDPVALVVQQTTDLHQAAVLLLGVLYTRRFHQKRVAPLALQHPIDPLLVRRRQRRRPRFRHRRPHPLVIRQIRTLKNYNKKKRIFESDQLLIIFYQFSIIDLLSINLSILINYD